MFAAGTGFSRPFNGEHPISPARVERRGGRFVVNGRKAWNDNAGGPGWCAGDGLVPSPHSRCTRSRCDPRRDLDDHQDRVTAHLTAVWTARQIIEAVPDDSAPRFLLRDRDAIYGKAFARRVQSKGIREVLTAPRAPWQNPFVERVIGSIRRESAWITSSILSEAHLGRLLHADAAYYNTTRPHQSLDGRSPQPRAFEPPLSTLPTTCVETLSVSSRPALCGRSFCKSAVRGRSPRYVRGQRLRVCDAPRPASYSS